MARGNLRTKPECSQSNIFRMVRFGLVREGAWEQLPLHNKHIAHWCPVSSSLLFLFRISVIYSNEDSAWESNQEELLLALKRGLYPNLSCRGRRQSRGRLEPRLVLRQPDIGHGRRTYLSLPSSTSRDYHAHVA